MEKVIGFWRPSEKNGEFSQWYKSQGKEFQFQDEHDKYVCMEQYMMAQKAILFNDPDTHDKIMRELDPANLKKLGREVKNFNARIWDEHKLNIVIAGNKLKFGQNPDLRKKLLSTGDAILCEASPYDNIWGIGMSVKDAGWNNPQSWQGENLLGKALMEVRKYLKDHVES